MTIVNKENVLTPINFSEMEGVARQIVQLKNWAEDKDDKGTKWARKEANKILGGYSHAMVISYILPLVDELVKEAYLQSQVEQKCDDLVEAMLECEVNRDDWAYESFRGATGQAEGAAMRAQDKIDFLEQKPGINRATIDNKRAYYLVATQMIMHMECLQDQYELGLQDKQFVRVRLGNIYKAASSRMKEARLLKVNKGGKPVVTTEMVDVYYTREEYELIVDSMFDMEQRCSDSFGVGDTLPSRVKGQKEKKTTTYVGGTTHYQWYIPGCGLSMTSLRAVCNTALTCLEEMGYRIPNSWWKRDGKKLIVVHEFTNENEREQMSQEDWDAGVHQAFYSMFE